MAKNQFAAGSWALDIEREEKEEAEQRALDMKRQEEAAQQRAREEEEEEEAYQRARKKKEERADVLAAAPSVPDRLIRGALRSALVPVSQLDAPATSTKPPVSKIAAPTTQPHLLRLPTAPPERSAGDLCRYDYGGMPPPPHPPVLRQMRSRAEGVDKSAVKKKLLPENGHASQGRGGMEVTDRSEGSGRRGLFGLGRPREEVLIGFGADPVLIDSALEATIRSEKEALLAATVQGPWTRGPPETGGGQGVVKTRPATNRRELDTKTKNADV